MMQLWIENITAHWQWFMLASVLMFFGSLLAVPYLAARIPANYFAADGSMHESWPNIRSPLREILLIIKQLVGILIILAGILMLALPGQGILTIMIGLMLIRFPGKYRLVRWMVRRPRVLKTINWMRARSDKPPLEL